MDDFPTRIPDLLESATARVRALTVDRVARILKIAALGMVMTMLVLLALVFLFVGLTRIVEGLILHAFWPDFAWAMEIAYAAVGALFLAGGALVWSARAKRKAPASPAE